ncbi:hypothetical protein Hanom_Chr10g00953841 [Helianthus anomalus]
MKSNLNLTKRIDYNRILELNNKRTLKHSKLVGFLFHSCITNKTTGSHSSQHIFDF